MFVATPNKIEQSLIKVFAGRDHAQTKHFSHQPLRIRPPKQCIAESLPDQKEGREVRQNQSQSQRVIGMSSEQRKAMRMRWSYEALWNQRRQRSRARPESALVVCRSLTTVGAWGTPEQMSFSKNSRILPKIPWFMLVYPHLCPQAILGYLCFRTNSNHNRSEVFRSTLRRGPSAT